MKTRSLVLLFIFMILTGGVLIYSVTRSESIYLNQWLAQLGNGKMQDFFQALIQNAQLPQWIIYSLPDALWMMALTMLVMMIWDFNLHKKSIPWIAIAIAVGILYEIFQGFYIVRGTFDGTDLIFIFMGALLPISFIMLKLRSCKTT